MIPTTPDQNAPALARLVVRTGSSDAPLLGGANRWWQRIRSVRVGKAREGEPVVEVRDLARQLQLSITTRTGVLDVRLPAGTYHVDVTTPCGIRHYTVTLTAEAPLEL